MKIKNKLSKKQRRASHIRAFALLAFLGIGLRGTFYTATTDVTRDNVHKHDVLDPGGQEGRSISFDHIIKTGEVNSNKFWHALFTNNYTLDLEADDAFADAVRKLEQQTKQKIKNNEELQSLLQKDIWSKKDRVMWEAKTCEIISNSMLKIPGLRAYRQETASRPQSLNELSTDIRNNTETIEFECEFMSTIEGITLQKIDNNYLPARQDEKAYKQATKYYLMSGFCVDIDSVRPEGHSFIMSNSTGNVIEGTSQTMRSYYETITENYSIADFINGKPAATVCAKTGEFCSYQSSPSIDLGKRAIKAHAESIKDRIRKQNVKMHLAPEYMMPKI